MVWFKVDDGLHASHKVLRLPRSVRLSAIGLWTLAGAWSAHEELDGFVPDYILPELGSTPRVAAALVECGLWRTVKGGSQFSNWAEYQPTRAEIETNREKERERKRKYRNGGQTPESQRDTQRDTSGSPTTPTRPDPTRPLTSVPEIMAGGTTGLEPPPRKCSKHANVAVPPKCGECADARIANDAWRLAHIHDPLIPSSVIRADPVCEHDRPAGTFCDICGGLAVAS